jgi:hypothetical protein
MATKITTVVDPTGVIDLNPLWFPDKPKPTRVMDWSTEQRPEWSKNLGSTAGGGSGSYASLYAPLSTDGAGAGGGLLEGSIVIGGGAKIQLSYDQLTHEEVNLLYQFWQRIVIRESSRQVSAFRIRAFSCLWSLGDFPSDFKVVNQLWSVADRQILFTRQGYGECGPLQNCALTLISVPEVLQYQ